MRFNQYSYINFPKENVLSELKKCGFDLQNTANHKDSLETFLRRFFFTYQDTNYPLSILAADKKTDLLTFFQSEDELTADIFYTVAFQLLGFSYLVDFEDSDVFRKETGFPIIYGDLIENLYQLLNTRTKKGNTLIDQLVSDGLIPEDNDYHYFNGKSLATFSNQDVIREVVYVESRVDTDQKGLSDLVKVSIIRPRFDGKIPAIMTASPYHQGTNDKASDKALYKMEGELEVKLPHKIELEKPQLNLVQPQGKAELIAEAEEKLTHINSSYTLNDYFLPRGFANLYVSGVGTKDSTGFMTNGDYQQIEAYKNVIDWLNGRCRAFTDHTRQRQVKADWSNGKVATTGLSYLGTMSNGLATTGVDGLEVIIAEAGISSWYNYYRENGLVTSPGGYPGEDFDSLAELTYSRNLLASDYIRGNEAHQADLEKVKAQLDRKTGDYNQFWHDRNYLLNAHKVKAEVVFTLGGQENCETFSLGQEEQAIQNQYPDKDFERYGKTYQTFNTELYQGKANQITINLPVTKDLHLNGRAQLNLRIKSSTNKGLLSAQLLEFGQKKYLQPYPAILSARTIDNGRYHMLENLCELPFRPEAQRVVTKGYLNLQNRNDLLLVEDITADEWMDVQFELQPTIYKLKEGDTLRLVLYTTDFEITIRDNTDYHLTVDLAQSMLTLPC
ncbi:x-prolyl-dipeptidyl aminopeptidase [Streptococcus pneumoniae]|nr:x-prolyl-dipeptidyl aminopeptidase [Streptococcus pneumoniae]